MIKGKKERRCCLIWHGKRRCFVARCRTDTGWRRGDPRVLRIFFFSFISLSLLLSLLRRKAKSDAIDGSVRRHGCVSVGGCRRRRLTTASLSVALLHQGKRWHLSPFLSSPRRKGRSLPIGGSVGWSGDVSVGGCRRGRATAISLSVSFLSSAESLRALSQANRR